MTRLRRLAAATTLLAAVAGCSSTVTGHGAFGGGTVSATPTGSATPTPTSSGDSGRSQLSCTGGTVLRPSNAPYCYLLPSGFKDVSALTSTTVGQSGEHPSSVALASENITQTVRDLIIVLDFTLRLDTDALSDTELTQQLDTLIGQFEAQGFTFASKVPGRISVDGARGFTYRARSREGYSSDLVFAFRGTQEVELNCQYKQHQADIRRACASILTSLQIVKPS
jgi:hypothetical protein